MPTSDSCSSQVMPIGRSPVVVESRDSRYRCNQEIGPGLVDAVAENLGTRTEDSSVQSESSDPSRLVRN